MVFEVINLKLSYIRTVPRFYQIYDLLTAKISKYISIQYKEEDLETVEVRNLMHFTYDDFDISILFKYAYSYEK